MKAFISGGTGFVGTELTSRLVKEGWDVVITGRSGRSPFEDNKAVRVVACDTKIPGAWQSEVTDANVVINLAGKNIFTRWNEKNKKEIEDSRLLTTQNIVEAISENSETIFLSTSAGGIYGDRNDSILNEESLPGSGFLSNLCVKWEEEALKADDKAARTILMRFGMVLGKNGGALKMMLPSFRFFVGGSLGSGKNWVPWMHIDDLCSAILHIINNKSIKGPVNFCSPLPVSHKDFVKSLGKSIRRPSFFTLPPFIAKAVMGELVNEIMCSQRMSPEKLIESGFDYGYETIDNALLNIVSG